MWHGNVRAYLNRSCIEILSSVDTDSSFKPRKKKELGYAIAGAGIKPAACHLPAHMQILIRKHRMQLDVGLGTLPDYTKPQYDSSEREGLCGASNFLQPFRKWRKLPLHPDLNCFFQREKEFLHVDAHQDVLEALTLQDRRPSVCLPSARPECQMCLG